MSNLPCTYSITYTTKEEKNNKLDYFFFQTEELCIQKCLRSGYVFKRDGQTWKQVKYNGETGKIIYKVYQSNQTHIETNNFIANISITPVQETKKWYSEFT